MQKVFELKIHWGAALHLSWNNFRLALFLDYMVVHMPLTVALLGCCHRLLPDWIELFRPPWQWRPFWIVPPSRRLKESETEWRWIHTKNASYSIVEPKKNQRKFDRQAYKTKGQIQIVGQIEENQYALLSCFPVGQTLQIFINDQ